MRAHLCHDLPLLHVLLHGSIQRAPTEQVEAEEVAREDVRVVGGAWADMESGPRFALGPPRGFESPTVHKGAGIVRTGLSERPAPYLLKITRLHRKLSKANGCSQN